MNIRVSLGLAMLLSSWALVASGQQSGDAKADGKRFLLTQAVRASSTEKDLNKAAVEGYRLVGTWYSGQLASILERAPDSAPKPEYRCVDAYGIPDLDKEVKRASSEGFRLVPRTLTQMSASSRGTVGQIRLVMERTPGSGGRYDYFVTSTRQPQDAVGLSGGYTLAGMMTWGVGYVLIGEKPQMPAAVTEPVSSSMPSDRYRLVTGSPGAELQAQLSTAAAAGFRVALSSTGSPAPLLIMEKTSEPSNPFEYLVVSGRDARSMTTELNAAGAKGFRASPAVFALPSAVVMEKAPGFQGAHEYRILERMLRLSFGKDFVQVTADGWVPVGVSHGGEIMLLEKTR